MGPIPFVQGNIYYEMALILALSAGIGVIGQKLRQPLIVSFLAVGIFVGPSVLRLIERHEEIEILAQIGISLLLFVVGLRLDVQLIKTLGPVALATGLGQVVFTSVIGFLIALSMGMSIVVAAYVSVALTFSSTIIIVKLLSDKKEIDSLHGRIAVGFLIVQDICAIIAMILLTASGGGLSGERAVTTETLAILGKGIFFLAAIALLMRFLLPRLTAYLARSQELLMLFAIAWAILLGAAGDALGFSKEVGAFLGGVSLASTGYRESIGARLITLRDFLLLFFFIDLGARLELGTLGMQVGNALILSAFVLIGNPVIVLAIMGFMGYRKRTSFLAGLTVAQISEFSLILGALGVSLGHIDIQSMGLITLVGVVTICASTYMILNSGALYRWLAPLLTILERKDPHREAASDSLPETTGESIILLGLGNYGGELAENLLERRKRVVGVDFDPQALKQWREQGLAVLYGDAGDPELLDQLPLEKARWVVSTVRDRDLNLTLLKALAERGFGGRMAIAARDEEEALIFRSSGAHVVLRPFRDAAEQAADALTEAMHAFPMSADWPLTLHEIRLRSGSAFAGHTISQIPLRAETGVSILAVSRAGKVYFDPNPKFQLFPGDRVVLLGDSKDISRAEAYLERLHLDLEGPNESREENNFTVDEIQIGKDSPYIGRTLAALRFRQDHGVTIIGIRRGDARITSPKADEKILEGDRLLIFGESEVVDRLRRSSPL
jgi:Kef-type K+ transport system membrane component KefB/Trk K+ transport system NAD-binding subunit